MRVLHLHSGNLYGGIETVLVTLARSRDACPTMEPHFALSFEGRLGEELRAAQVPVHQLGPARVSRPLGVRRARRALKSLLAKIPFDIAICHSLWSLVIFGPAIRRADVSLVLWAHAPVGEGHWLETLARRIRPDLVLCNSRYTEATLPKLFRGVPAETLYCPIEGSATPPSPGERRSLRAEFGTPDGATVVLQVGRMEAWKGHALHLQALSRINGSRTWVCWQVGGPQHSAEGHYLAELKELTGRFGIGERVRFLGQRSDITRILHAADIYCQPNTRPEPFGVAIVEALYAGLPVIASSLGGARETITPDCGILVAPGNVIELTSALQLLMDDPGLRRRLGSQAPERAEQLCAISTQMPRLSAILSSLRKGVA